MALVLLITGCGPALDQVGDKGLETGVQEELQDNKQLEPDEKEETALEDELNEDGYYTSKEDVGLYIHRYGKLPENFISKKEASKLGWNPKEGNLWQVTDRKSIGGDYFGNREGLLPKAQGRKYWECDIDYDGGYRGGKRIVYSNDGLIYYTDDHYKSFTLLYGREE